MFGNPSAPHYTGSPICTPLHRHPLKFKGILMKRTPVNTENILKICVKYTTSYTAQVPPADGKAPHCAEAKS